MAGISPVQGTTQLLPTAPAPAAAKPAPGSFEAVMQAPQGAHKGHGHGHRHGGGAKPAPASAVPASAALAPASPSGPSSSVNVFS